MLTGHRPSSEIITALDLGTSKICCVIAERVFGPAEQGPQLLRILGIGQHRADGIRGGVVVDPEFLSHHPFGNLPDIIQITCGHGWQNRLRQSVEGIILSRCDDAVW